MKLLYRGVALGVALVFCLPPPDLLGAPERAVSLPRQATAAAPSSRSIFAGKGHSHAAVRQRNLRELDARQGMRQAGAGDEGGGTRATADGRPATGALSLAALADLSGLAVPPEAGQVVEVWSPEDRDSSLVARDSQAPTARVTGHESRVTAPTVILLQDLHTQPDAQRAEAAILTHLATAYGLTQIASEGAWRQIDVSLPRRFPVDRALRDLVAETFLEAGEFTAEEYVAITQRHDLTLTGVEDAARYHQHLATYHEVMAAADRAAPSLAGLHAACAALKTRLYGHALQ